MITNSKKTLLVGFSIIFSFSIVSSSPIQNDRQKRDRPTPEKLMEELDSNKDNKLSENEVKGPLKKDFSKTDTNKDQFITLEELKAFKPPHPPKRN